MRVLYFWGIIFAMEKKGSKHIGTAILAVLVLLDLTLWYAIFSGRTDHATRIHFLDVGQGDSALFTFPNRVQMLIDAGPPRSASRPLSRAMRREDRYIDLAILTHPELDHMGGYAELLERYEFGAFLWNGRTDANAKEEWRELTDALRARSIPMIAIGAGDRILIASSTAHFISPDRTWAQSGAPNDAGLVMHIGTPNLRALFTADIDSKVEADLVKKEMFGAEVLKIAHHGSKYSSSETFLRAVAPHVAVVSAGKGNRYGHPTQDVLARIAHMGAEIFRTDQNGTVEIVGEGTTLKIFVGK